MNTFMEVMNADRKVHAFFQEGPGKCDHVSYLEYASKSAPLIAEMMEEFNCSRATPSRDEKRIFSIACLYGHLISKMNLIPVISK